MKKYFLMLIAAIMVISCTKQPAQEQSGEQEVQETQEVKQETVVGGQYLDFTALTPLAQELSLSDLVGKTDYVLVDFWASWCGPCRRLIPVLKEIYASQPKGRLEIFSCSVDQDENEWKKALEEELMPWKQVREDAEHPCADKYNVQFIPHTILIDRNGTIVAINPEEPQIEAILFGE